MLKRTSYGVLHVDELDYNNPVVYESENSISRVTYAGDVSLLYSSITLKDWVKDALQSFNGKVSLGTTNNKLRNAHLYSSQATTLDGIERLCYISNKDEDTLLVKEFSTARGSKYSAYWSILSDILAASNIKKEGSSFIVDKNEMTLFVYLLNKVLELRNDDSLELDIINEVDDVLRHDVRYYFFKVRWHFKQSGLIKESDILKLKHSIVNCKNKTELDNVKMELEGLLKLVNLQSELMSLI